MLSGANYTLAKPAAFAGTLEGWYNNAAFGSRLFGPTDTTIAITENKTLYAKLIVTFTWSDISNNVVCNYIRFNVSVSSPPPLADSELHFAGTHGTTGTNYYTEISAYGTTRTITVVSGSAITLPTIMGSTSGSYFGGVQWRQHDGTIYENRHPIVQISDNTTFTAFK